MFPQRHGALTVYTHRVSQRWLPLVALLLTAATLLPEASAAPASPETEGPAALPSRPEGPTALPERLEPSASGGDTSSTATRRMFVPMIGHVPAARSPRPTPTADPTPRPSATPNPDPTPRPSATPNPGAPDDALPGAGQVVQGLFFAKPLDGTATSTVAQRASWMSLTRGHARWLEELRGAGYREKAFQYLIALEVQGPGPYANSSSRCDSAFAPSNNTVAYNVGDFCKYLHPNESWFLHNGKGQRLVYKRSSGGYDYQMNPNSGGWRAFFRDRVRRDLIGEYDLGFDGIFLDNIRTRLANLKTQLHNSDGTVREYADDGAYRRAVVSYLAYLRAALREGGELWGSLTDFYNVPAGEYFKYTAQLDGYMNEAWGPGYFGRPTDAAHWDKILRIAETTLKQGKGLMALVQGERDDHRRQTLGLASYLLISDGQQAYFRYAYLRQPYTDWWQYSNYGVKLGAPKGARYRSGSLWRRDFACGYVTVDPAAERGTIVQTCN